MTLSDFSVLLLAWDDADPRVAVLGRAALPPTLPLVYRLAAQQPVLAVYPHLPAETATVEPAGPASPTPPANAPAASTSAETAAALNALTVETSAPGVRLLPAAPHSGAFGVPALARPSSRIVGLDELPAAGLAQRNADSEAEAAPSARPAALARSQWPTGPGGGYPNQLQAPAAPYLGASVRPEAIAKTVLVPALLPAFSSTVREAADLPQTAGQPAAAAEALASATPPSLPNAPGAAPAPDLPAVVIQPEVFSETTEEPGPAETAAVLAAEDNLTVDEAAEAEAVEESPTAPAAEPAPEAHPAEPAAARFVQPSLDGLNFRMIQYARQAAQLVRNCAEFGVIYSPSWPAWLAALELRNSTGRPLVLYATGLAADFLCPAERGWLPEVERMALRRARLVLVPTEAVRQRLAAHYGSGIGEVRVVAPHDEAAVLGVLSEVALGPA